MSRLTFAQRFAHFSEHTTFHGFREFSESRRWFQKAAWLLIMIGSVGMLGFALKKQVSQYLSGPTMTRVAYLEDDEPYKYPSVLFGLKDWTFLDMDKINRSGITYEELQYAKGFMSANLSLDSAKDLRAIEQSLRDSLRRLNVTGLSDLFANTLALESFHDASEWSFVYKRLGPGGGCIYNLDLSAAAEVDLSLSMHLDLQFDFAKYFKNAERLQKFFDGPNRNGTRSIRRPPKPFFYNMESNQVLDLEVDTKLILTIDSKVYRELYNCSWERVHHPAYNPHLCKLDCAMRANLSFGQSCIKSNSEIANKILNTQSFHEGTARICHNGLVVNGSLIGMEEPIWENTRNTTISDLQQREKMLAECNKKLCPFRCERIGSIWATQVLLNYAESRDEKDPDRLESVISIDFPNRNTLMIYEEFQQYDWNDMVSDLGGLLGLWLGASMMSLFQIVHLCCRDEDGKREVLPLRHSRVSSVAQS